jgi:hypothetical protein
MAGCLAIADRTDDRSAMRSNDLGKKRLKEDGVGD